MLSASRFRLLPLLQTMASDRPFHIRMARSLPARMPENFLTAVCSPLSTERFFDLESPNLYFTAQAGGKRRFPDFVVSKSYARNDGTYEKKILTIVEVKRDSTKLREDVIQLTRYVDLGRKQNHVPGLRSYLVFGGDCRAFQHDASGRLGIGGGGGWKRSVFVDADPPQDDALTNKLYELAIRHWNLVLVFHHAFFSLVFRFANSWWALSLFSCWFGYFLVLILYPPLYDSLGIPHQRQITRSRHCGSFQCIVDGILKASMLCSS